MRILFNRFAKKRSYMNIDDFSACLSRVKIMDGGYKFFIYKLHVFTFL